MDICSKLKVRPKAMARRFTALEARRVVGATGHQQGKHVYRWYTAPPALLAAARAARPVERPPSGWRALLQEGLAAGESALLFNN